MPETVSVIVPLYNGADTLHDTLTSVRAQTWRDLEIVVVDDGSTDGSAEIARLHQQQDPRITVVAQANAGVAAARNHGAAVTRGRFLAPIDADDLWAPGKIALQMQALEAGGTAMGLVYTGYVNIDEAGRMSRRDYLATEAGQVLQRLCRRNFVGNGSSLLIRREAFERVGGYDASLRAAQAQGCEDLLFCLRVAEHFAFGVVPQPLTGYRVTEGNMSSDLLQMHRSFEMVREVFGRAYPDYAGDLKAQSDRMLKWLLGRALRSGRRQAAMAIWRKMLRQQGGGALAPLVELAPEIVYAMAPAGLREAGMRMFRPGRQQRALFQAAGG